MRNKELSTFFIQVWVLACLILAGIQGYSYFFVSQNTDQNSQDISKSNSQNFTSAYIWNYATTGVALSTKVWLSPSSADSIGWNSAYQSISFIGVSPEEKRIIRKDLISQNMIYIREYLNLSQSNIIDILSSSSDRGTTLEGYISQMRFRYNNATTSIISLELQKSELVDYLNTLSRDIDTLKATMENNFSGNNVDITLSNVDSYFLLRDDYTQAFTDIVFINQFLSQYKFLNSYNSKILDTIINNKQQIINQTYIVIPDTWDEYLRPFNLIFDEWAEELNSN